MKLCCIVLGILLAAATTAHAAVWYVDTDNSGAEDGTAWATAFTTIQPAIDTATSGDEVWVAEGVYKGTTISLKGGVDVFGGFSGTEGIRSERNLKSHTSTIDGEDARRCVDHSSNGIL